MAGDGGHKYNPMTSVSEFMRSVECIRRSFAGRYWIVVSATRKSSTWKKGNGGFLIVEACNSAYFTKLTPIELIELGTELVRAGNRAIRKSVNE
jgi:hypothetical protein